MIGVYHPLESPKNKESFKFAGMKLHEAGRVLGSQLSALYDASEAAAIAALALDELTGLSAAERLSRKDEELTTKQQNQLDQYITQFLRHEPIQYVLQKAHFYGLDLYVNQHVLIPRSETEELADWIIRDIKQSGKDVFTQNASQADNTTELKILDVGTGSGCIALALKNAAPRAEVWGCDCSDEALNVARRNGSMLDIRVDFQAVDFLKEEQQRQLPTVDIIVSNPPYIPQSQRPSMEAHVVEYEPSAALFVPDEDPLVFYKVLASFGKFRLHHPGALYMEIHEDAGKEVVELFEKEGYQNVILKKDMQGKDRMIKAKTPISR